MFVFSVLIILIIILCILREKLLNFSSFLLVSIIYLICYGIFPFVFFLIEIPIGYDGSWLTHIKHDKVSREYLYYYAGFLALLSYISYFVGYKIFFFKPKILFKRYYQLKDYSLIKKISKYIFYAGFIFLVGYIALYGSVSQMLLGNRRMTYSSHDSVEVESPFTFLIMLAKVVIFSCYLFWGLSKMGKINKKYFYISLILSLFILFRFSGRLILITFILNFMLAGFIYKQKLPKLKSLLLVGFVGMFILFGKAVFRMFIYDDAIERASSRYKGDSFFTPLLDILGGFSFPYFNIVHNLSIDSHKSLYFLDLLQMPLFVLPTKLFPFAKVDTTIIVNTYNMEGLRIGKIPADIVTYGYLNMGVLGVILIAFLFGILCKYIDSFSRINVPPITIVVLVALIFLIGFRVMYFEPRQLIRGYFYFLLGLVVLSYFKPKIKKRFF